MFLAAFVGLVTHWPVGATIGGRVAGGLGTFVGALVGIPVGGAIQVIVRELRRGPEVAEDAALQEPQPSQPPPEAPVDI